MIPHEQMYLNVTPEHVIQTLNIDECLVQCVLTPNCTSLNYLQTNNEISMNEAMEGECQILNTDRFRQITNYKTQAEMVSKFGVAAMTHFSIQVCLLSLLHKCH